MNVEVKKISSRKYQKVLNDIWQIELNSSNQNTCYYPPDNYVDVIVALSGPVERINISDGKKYTLKKGHVYFSNIRSKASILKVEDESKLLILKLYPSIQKIFSDEKLNYQRDSLIDLELPVAQTAKWKESVDQQDVRSVLNHLYDAFEVCLRKNDKLRDVINKADEHVSESVRLIKGKKGRIFIKELNRLTGVCKSTLEHKFNREVGLSPKEFCRIEKLMNFFANYQVYRQEMSLTQLSYMSGYYDQSHLIKDFHYFLELNPRRFLKEEKILW